MILNKAFQEIRKMANLIGIIRRVRVPSFIKTVGRPTFDETISSDMQLESLFLKQSYLRLARCYLFAQTSQKIVTNEADKAEFSPSLRPVERRRG